MADACIIDAFAIYSHYLQVIYEVVYTVAKQFNNGGGGTSNHKCKQKSLHKP